MSSKPLAVVLASGGMDSCVTIAIARETHEVALLHATYGQRTAARERHAFEEIADHFSVPQTLRRTLRLDFLREIGGSALTDETVHVPEGDPEAPIPDGIPVTYVPFRNAHLIASAVSWAEVIGAETVFYGAVEEDSSGYPDCSETFVDAMQQAVRAGTGLGDRFSLRAPLIRMSKRDIVVHGVASEAPLQLTWSCYQNEDVPCARCESCRLRARGFAAAGVADPIL